MALGRAVFQMGEITAHLYAGGNYPIVAGNVNAGKGEI